MPENLRHTIINILSHLEQQYNIQILFAVENGSRAWKMESADSDYDIRFVFWRPLPDYISLEPANDVISAAFDAQLAPCAAHDALFDICGFDIFKFLRLLNTSNPTVIEWLHADSVYTGQIPFELKQYSCQNFNPTALFHHYRSLAANNRQAMLRQNIYNAKKYLYVFRGLLNAYSIIEFGKIPALDFTHTLENCRNELGDELYHQLTLMISAKQSGKEKQPLGRLPLLDEYIDSFLTRFEKIQPAIAKPEAYPLNIYLQNLLIGNKQ